MRLLAIASANGAEVGYFDNDEAGAHAAAPETRGLGGTLPTLIAQVLANQPPPQGIAVVIGPGSFTGLRAGIAAAIGVGLGAGVPVAGVSVAEALRTALDDDGRAPWVALRSGRGHVFLDTGAGMRAVLPAALPQPAGPVAVAGDAAIEVASVLAARGADVRLTGARRLRLADVARIGARRLAGTLPPLAPAPLYVDPPAVTVAATPA